MSTGVVSALRERRLYGDYVRHPADILNYGGIIRYSDLDEIRGREVAGKYRLNKNNKFIVSITRRLG